MKRRNARSVLGALLALGAFASACSSEGTCCSGACAGINGNTTCH